MNKILIIIGTLTIAFSACKTKCPDNLTEYVEKIPYANGDLVTFVNDTLGEVVDTVYVDLAQMENYYYHKTNGDGDQWDCGNWHEVTYSNNFSYQIAQAPNYYFNQVDLSFSLFVFNDTVCHYNNDTVSAYVLFFNEEHYNFASFTDKNDFYYDNYIFIDTPQYKLIEYYTIYSNGDTRKWKIKE